MEMAESFEQFAAVYAVSGSDRDILRRIWTEHRLYVLASCAVFSGFCGDYAANMPMIYAVAAWQLGEFLT